MYHCVKTSVGGWGGVGGGGGDTTIYNFFRGVYAEFVKLCQNRVFWGFFQPILGGCT